MTEFLGAHGPALIALGVVAAMFALFLTERFPTEVVAIGGVAVFLATGVLSTGEFLAVLANPAPITIGAMFILSGALARTGALDAVTHFAARHAEERPAAAIGGLAATTVATSAFMNNTPVVVMLIPVAVKLAKALGTTASRLLIPLSYAAILGGMLTLIGTSTNLLVDGVARAGGQPAFGLFEITPLGLVLAVWGLIYLRFAAPRLLPERESLTQFLDDRPRQKFFTDVVLPAGSPLAGEKVLEIDIFNRDGARVIDVLRGDESLRRDLAGVTLADGDRVVLRTGVDELLTLRETGALAVAGAVDPVSSRSSVTVEALVGPDCRLIGRTLGTLRLRRRFGVYPLAVHRRNERVGATLDEVRIRVGDTLLLEGAPDDIQRLAAEADLVNLNAPAERPWRRQRAPIVLATLAGIVGLAALNVAPIAALAVIGVAVVLLTRCIDAEEAFQAVDGRLLALIFAMLGVGQALQSTGAVQLIVDALEPRLMGVSPALALWVVILLTSTLTELVSNSAVAVVVTPVAIALAAALGVDPRPFVVGVMVAASASFATPIGYQTNTMVYAPGGYRFTDFVRIGLPLNLSIGALAALMIPLFWPF